MQIDELTKKVINGQPGEKLKAKRRALKLTFLIILIIIFIASLLFVLMLHKPSDYTPPAVIKDKQVSKYITHVITQDIYNGAQMGEPFDVIIDKEGIKDIIARSDWPKEYSRAILNTPVVELEQGLIVMKGMVKLDNIDLFVRLEGGGYILENGMMNVDAKRLMVGAVNITIPAKIIAAGIYQNQKGEKQMSPDDYRTKIYDSLLFDIPFDPVFEVDNTKIRVADITIDPDKIILHFTPAK